VRAEVWKVAPLGWLWTLDVTGGTYSGRECTRRAAWRAAERQAARVKARLNAETRDL
jgi:hypothetical protein